MKKKSKDSDEREIFFYPLGLYKWLFATALLLLLLLVVVCRSVVRSVSRCPFSISDTLQLDLSLESMSITHVPIVLKTHQTSKTF